MRAMVGRRWLLMNDSDGQLNLPIRHWITIKKWFPTVAASVCWPGNLIWVLSGSSLSCVMRQSVLGNGAL
jgi:hypothetical protein